MGANKIISEVLVTLELVAGVETMEGCEHPACKHPWLPCGVGAAP